MKIVRHQNHYTIRCTPTEFEAISNLTTRGAGEVEAMHLHEWRELDRRFRQGFHRVTRRGSWAVEDRRKKT